MAKTESHWRTRARQVIQQTLATLPDDATDIQVKAALREAYPFGERQYHPYRIWCDEQRKALKLPDREPECKFLLHEWAWADAEGEIPRPHHSREACTRFTWFLAVKCDFCYYSECVGCLICRERIAILARLLNDSAFMAGLKTIRARPNDDDRRLVLADWLEERGYGEIAILFRQSTERK